MRAVIYLTHQEQFAIVLVMSNEPKTLAEAIRYFSDEDTCLQFMVSLRWPEGVSCPTCGSKEVTFLASRRVWKCKSQHQKQQFSIKVATVFEDSPISLTKWLPALWLLVSCKNGVSSYEIHRGIGVTQKTAWFMLHRLRLVMRTGTFEKLSGAVEADETFIGSLARNMHKSKRERVIKGTGGAGKTAVMGLLERHTDKKASRVHAKVVPNVKRETLHGEIRKHVAPGAEVHTDEWVGYKNLDADYVHNVINHAEADVQGAVHTNGIENFLSLQKRMIKGTDVSVDPFPLSRYLDEEAFRFNEREGTDADRFLTAAGVVGKRSTYKELIGNVRGLPTT